MSRQYYEEQLAWSTTSGTAVASTTTETILHPAYTLPATYLQDGRSIRLTAKGGYGTTGTPTLTFKIRYGGVSGTVLCQSGDIVTPSGAGGGASMTALWEVDAIIQTRTNGATGTVMTNGAIKLFTTGTAAGSLYPLVSGTTGGTTPASATVDLTAAGDLVLTADWGTNNAANSIQLHNLQIESLN